MSSKTPSSLKWLASKRSRLDGKRIAYQNELAELSARVLWLQGQIDKATGLISAVDATIGLHEVQIEPSDIQSVRPSKKALFPRGSVGRSVLSFLRRHPDQWFSTGELVAVLCEAGRVSQVDYDAESLRRLLRSRLRAMAVQKILERHDERPSNSEQRWRLYRQLAISQVNRVRERPASA